MKQMILPYPQKVTCSDGAFSLSGCSVGIGENMDYRVVKAALKLRGEIAGITGEEHVFSASLCSAPGQIRVVVQEELPKEGYILTVNPQNVYIAGGDAAGCFYGLQSLRQLLKQCGEKIPCMHMQ